MMKFPVASAGGTAPSGSSFAETYPGVLGSRVGGVGRGAGAGVCGGAVAGCCGGAVFCAITGARPVNTAIRKAILSRVDLMDNSQRESRVKDYGNIFSARGRSPSSTATTAAVVLVRDEAVAYA
jgi:hypothetical protein